MKSVRIIKKYPNRRLYDTVRGAYITLVDVKKLVLNHVDLQVIDARTKKDLTQSTLLQIITEHEATQTPIFTKAMLEDFIRFYHEKSQNLITQYLEQAIKLFSKQKELLQSQWEVYEKLLADPTFMQQAMQMQKWWLPDQSGPLKKKRSTQKSHKK